MKIQAALNRSYLPVLAAFSRQYQARRIVARSTAKIAAKTVAIEGIEFWFSSPAVAGYENLVVPGLKQLLDVYQKGKVNPDEAQQAQDEIAGLEQQIQAIRNQVKELETDKVSPERHKKFWQEEKKQLQFDLETYRKITIKTFQMVDDEISIDPRSDLPVVSQRVPISSRDRTEYKKLQKQITWWSINVADVGIKAANERVKVLDGEIQTLYESIHEIEDIIEEWKSEYVPDIAEKQAQIGQYWTEFISYLSGRKTESFSFEGRGIEHLKGFGLRVFKYKRGRLRIIFRAFPGATKYYHILAIALRDEKTYRVDTKSSDKQWARDEPRFSRSRARVAGSKFELQLFMASGPDELWKTIGDIGRDFSSQIKGTSVINKPLGPALWTSSITGRGKQFESEWSRWTESEIPEKVSDLRVPLRVKPGAKVLHIRNRKDYDRVAAKYGFLHPIEQDYILDWSKLAKDFDGVHVVNPREKSLGFILNSWDVESTAWFNWGALEPAKDVY